MLIIRLHKCCCVYRFIFILYPQLQLAISAIRLLKNLWNFPASLCISRRGAEWKFPQTEMEKLRYQVFYQLWEKGYYLTTGGKLGGNFLCYPGKINELKNENDKKVAQHTISYI